MPSRRGNPDAKYHDLSELVDPVWEKQKWETTTQYSRFRMYRDMPTRSQTEAARHFGLSHDYMKAVSQRNLWVQRAEAYDKHLDTVGLAITEKTVRHHAATTAARVQELTESEWTIWQSAKSRVLALLSTGDAKDAQAAAQVIREAGKMARVALGLPTEGRKPGTGDGDEHKADLDAFLEHIGGSPDQDHEPTPPGVG